MCALSTSSTSNQSCASLIKAVLCRETKAQGPEKVELGALAAAVISAREGLTPLSFDEYVAIAADLGVKALDGALPAPSDDAAAGDARLAATQVSAGPAWVAAIPCSDDSQQWLCEVLDLRRCLDVLPTQWSDLLQGLAEELTDAEQAEIAQRRAALALSPVGAALAKRQVPCALPGLDF